MKLRGVFVFFVKRFGAQFHNSEEYTIFDKYSDSASDDDASLEESLTQLGESMYASYLLFLADYNAHRIVEKPEPQGQGENAEDEAGLSGTITMLFDMLEKDDDPELVKIFAKHIDDYAEGADEE